MQTKAAAKKCTHDDSFQSIIYNQRITFDNNKTMPKQIIREA